MTFTVFLVLFLFVLLGIPLLLVVGLFRKGRKEPAFKLMIVVITATIMWLIVEGFSYYESKSGNVLNPSYTWADQVTSTKESNLPYLHNPNMNWEGLSHGDLAVLNADADPYARKVQFKTDSDGFRNHTEIKQAELVVLGDSFTEAGNVNEEETYSFLLRKFLGVNVKNLGVSGYSTPDELVVFTEFGLPARPKTVILQVAESNDIIENIKYYNWVKGGKPPREISKVELKTKDGWKLASPTFRLYQKLFPLRLNEWSLQGIFQDASGRNWITRFSQLPQRIAITKNEITGWNVMKGSILRFQEICKQNGIRLVVMVIPDKVNVLGPLVSSKTEHLNRLKLIPEELTLAYLLKDYCAQLGVGFVDLQPELTKAAKQGKLVYLPMDTHLSPDGHEVVAESLAAYLTTPQ